MGNDFEKKKNFLDKIFVRCSVESYLISNRIADHIKISKHNNIMDTKTIDESKTIDIAKSDMNMIDVFTY